MEGPIEEQFSVVLSVMPCGSVLSLMEKMIVILGVHAMPTMEVKSSWDTCENCPKNHQRIIWYYYSYFLGHNLSVHVIPPPPPPSPPIQC